MKLLVALILIFAGTIHAQLYEFSGKVLDSESGSPLPYTSILLAGTNQGTVTNLDGNFKFKLQAGSYVIIMRYVGYRTDTLKISVPAKDKLLVKLVKQPVVLPDVVVTSEDPAYAIIREAIRRKKINRKGLNDYEYNVYCKNVVKSAGEIALVEESFIKGFSKPGDWEKEFILKIHRTENQKKFNHTINVTSDFTNKYMIDFSADTLSLLMNKVYLPIADNAFDYYDYKLLNIIKTDGAPVYIIKVIPLSKIQPLVAGTIYIDGESYSITKVDLHASEGVRFPYIHQLTFNFKQTLNKYDGYWLPDYVELDASFGMNFGGLIGFEPMSFQTINSITGYKINEPLPDSVLHAVRSNFGGFVSDTSKRKIKPAEISDEDIKKMRPIPLTDSEVKAFAELDSTMTIDKSIKLTGALAGFAKVSSGEKKSSGKGWFGQLSGFMTDHVYFDNNRAGYISLGGKYKHDFLKNKLYTNITAGYSFGLKKSIGAIQLGFRPKLSFIDAADFEYYRMLKEWQIIDPYSRFLNSAAISLGFNDQYNYYLADGFKIRAMKKLGRHVSLTLDYVSENQASVNNYYKKFQIIKRKELFRINPQIDDGRDARIGLSLQINNSPYDIQFIPQNCLIAGIELSRPFLNSDFNYTKMYAAGQLKIKTFYNELFLSPYLLLNAEASYLKGDYGVQHILSPVAAMGVYSPATAFKGLSPYRFTGDKMIAFHAEHNWRTIIFQALGLDFLTNSDLDIVTGGSVLRIWNDSKYFSELTQQKPYWEVYAGISRILGVIKLDFYYSSFKSVGATLSAAVIF